MWTPPHAATTLVNMDYTDLTVALSDAKARLSEVVRRVRTTGQAVIITVDGEPAARLAPVPGDLHSLSPTDVATLRVLEDAVRRIPGTPFDAVALIRDGRR